MSTIRSAAPPNPSAAIIGWTPVAGSTIVVPVGNAKPP